MSAIYHSANGIISEIKKEQAIVLTRRLKILRRRLQPWWNALCVRKYRR